MTNAAFVTLDQLIELAHGQATAVLIEFGLPQLEPAFLVVARTGEIAIVSTPFRNDDDKDHAVVAMRRMLRNLDALAYSFVAEGWSADYVVDTIAVMPRDRPDRIEVVVAMATDGREIKRAMWKLVRGDCGACVALKPLRPFGQTTFDIFGELLDTAH